MMNDILKNLIHQGCTVSFMDDILAFNKALLTPEASTDGPQDIGTPLSKPPVPEGGEV